MGTIIYQTKIDRLDLQNNPGVMYLFGDNDQRSGLGGQAKEMRGEQNAVGVRTKKAPHRRDNAFWTDLEFSENIDKIISDLLPVVNHLNNGGIVIIPCDGIGTGLSQMQEECPLTFEYLQKALKALDEFT